MGYLPKLTDNFLYSSVSEGRKRIMIKTEELKKMDFSKDKVT